MNDFVASNGIAITTTQDGRIILPNWMFSVSAQVHQALREFFQAETDELIGRFRHGPLLVYPDPEDPTDSVVVVSDERPEEPFCYTRWSPDYPNEYSAAARAYFDAHPEPKPWHDASIGDVWIMEPLEVAYTVVGGNEKWFTRGDVYGKVERRELDDPGFTSGRRIWPEVS